MNKTRWGVVVGVVTISIAAMFWVQRAGEVVQESTGSVTQAEEVHRPSVQLREATLREPFNTHPRMLVTDSAGAAIPGAEICDATAADRMVYFTNDRGEALLTGCAAGVRRFWITRHGYIGVDSNIAVASQEVVRVTLLKFAKMAGTVTNGRGEPIPDVSVQLKYEAESEPKCRFMITPDDNKVVLRGAVSRADGRFEMARVIPNRAFAIHAYHPEYGRATIPMEALEPETTTTSFIQLPDHTGIRGVAALEASRESAVVLHVLHRDPERHVTEGIRVVNAVDMEPFELRDIPSGVTLIVAMASDVGRAVVATAQVIVEKGRMVDVGTLKPAASVLRIRCEGVPLAMSRQVKISVQVLDPPKPMTYLPCHVVISCDEAADFAIVGLPVGRALVDAMVLEPSSRMPDMLYNSASERVTLDGDTQVNLVMTRRRPPTNLVVNLDPPPGIAKEILSAFVWIEDETGVVNAFSRAAVGHSQFQFQSLSAARVTLRAVAQGYTLTQSGLELVPEQITTINARGWSEGAACHGIVVDEAGNPVAAASVAFTVPTRESGQQLWRPLIQDISTDVEGRFSVGALPQSKGLQVAAWTSNARSDPHPLSAGAASGIVLRLKKVQK